MVMCQLRMGAGGRSCPGAGERAQNTQQPGASPSPLHCHLQYSRLRAMSPQLLAWKVKEEALTPVHTRGTWEENTKRQK